MGAGRVVTPRFSRKMLPISLPLICAETGRFSSDSAPLLPCSTSPVAFEPQALGRKSRGMLKCVARAPVSALRSSPNTAPGPRTSTHTANRSTSRSHGQPRPWSHLPAPLSGLLDFIPSCGRPANSASNRSLPGDCEPAADLDFDVAMSPSPRRRQLSRRADGAGRADLHDTCMSRRCPLRKIGEIAL